MAISKDYLVNLHASLKGEKLTTAGLRRIRRGVKRTGQAARRARTLTDNYIGALRRVAVVVPIWFLFRRIFTGIIQTIGNMVRSFVDLEEGLARIQTVMHGTTEAVEAGMIGIRRQILDVAMQSGVSINELAEAFYFLKTSNLDAEEATAAFIPTVQAMIGTGNSAKDTARALAGMYNTMGKYLGDNLTVHEKFQNIADTLTYTYATQDVQLGELIQSYTKLAPYLVGLDDSFEDIVTTLGFLNTQLLRGGRTGRLTGRAILQLTKNASKLAAVFGITFDPDKPISLLKTIRQIHESMGKTGKLTAKQGQALQEVFATRGGVAVRILIDKFDELNEMLELAGENMKGFAAKMAEIKMETIAVQTARMRNILQALFNDFVTGITGTGNLAEAISNLNDVLVDLTPTIRQIGLELGYFTQPLIQAISFITKFQRLMTATRRWRLGIDTETPIQNIGILIGLWEKFRKATRLVTFEEFVKQQEKLVEEAEKEAKIREKIAKAESEIEKTRLRALDKEKAGIASNINLLKLYGANQLDIAVYRLKALEQLKEEGRIEEDSLDLLKANLSVLEAQERIRKNMVDTIQKAQFNMISAMGRSELAILQVKEQQLNANRGLIGETQYMIDLAKLRLQQAIALQQAQEKEMNTITDIIMQYQKADELEKNKIKRRLELRRLSPEGLLAKYRMGGQDQRIIEEYWGTWSKEGERAIAEWVARQEHLPIPEVRQVLAAQGVELPVNEIQNFWETFVEHGDSAMERIFGKMPKLVPLPEEEIWRRILQPGFAGIDPSNVIEEINRRRAAIETKRQEKLLEIFPEKIDIAPTFGDISIFLPEDSLENMTEEVGKQIVERLKTDEALQKFLARVLRPKI